jgi:hypothetical protein
VHYFDPAKPNIERKAENVGWAYNIYRGQLWPGYDMDRYFSRLEQMSLAPVDELEQGSSGDISALAWARVAAYITSQFVRNPDLEDDIQDMIARGVAPDRILAGNPLDFQRVGAAVYRARWEFIRTSKDLLLNDRGITAVSSPDWKDEWGYIVPLRKRLAARIGGGPYEKRLTWNGTEWRIDIPIVSVGDQQIDVLNDWTWASAANELYGSSLTLLAETEARATKMRAALPDLPKHLRGAGMLTLPDQQRRDDEMLISWLPGGIQPPREGGPTRIVI